MESLKTIQSSEFVHLMTPYFAMALVKPFAMIAQLGVESGGRLRRHVEQNLLKPGLGVTSVRDGAGSFAQPDKLEGADGEWTYANAGWRVRVVDERAFAVRFSGTVIGDFFRMALATETCPASVWGKSQDKPFPPARGKSLFDVPKVTVDYAMPLLLHFPDYGLLKITCGSAGVRARQEMRPDPSMVGLNLGCTNTGYHTGRKAYHHGTVEVVFDAGEGCEDVELVFHVEHEHYPNLSGINLDDAKWNGLKRCWQSAFTLNPETLSMGDNIMLHGIAHLAIHFKSDMSVFTPPLLDGFTVHDVLRRQLEITFRDCVGAHGEISARYAAPEGRKASKDLGFFDGNTSNFIALYNYVAATGDWSLVTTYVDNLMKAGRFLMALDKDDDGILELPFDGNAFRQDRECRNWWDNFPFGHKDSYANLLAYRALGNLGEMMQFGHADFANEITTWRQKFASSFHRVFFNPATGVYGGWVSADGKMHDYMFTFSSAMAINEGLVEKSLAREVMQRLLDKLRAEGYGGWKWGIPGPLISVSEADGHIWEPMQRWGSYENGGFCGQTAYHFIQALYEVGMRETADEILFKMLDTFEHEFTHSGAFPGYMKSVDWRTKEGIPCGYNYLADNYYFLLAAITGHFGVAMPKVKLPADAVDLK